MHSASFRPRDAALEPDHRCHSDSPDKKESDDVYPYQDIEILTGYGPFKRLTEEPE